MKEVAEAQTVARFRGWAPFIALQVEYSLVERAIEGELVPMTLEVGLGITPWSPLRSGVLSGKRGGTTVNGETAPPWPLAPKSDGERH